MVSAVSAIGPHHVRWVLGAHATVRRGPTPLRPVQEPTPTLHPLRVITYQLRPDGRGVLMQAKRMGLKVNTRG